MSTRPSSRRFPPASVAALALAASLLVARAAECGDAPGDPADPPVDCNAFCEAKFQRVLGGCAGPDGVVDPECAARVKQEFDWTACRSDCEANGGHIDPPDPNPGDLTCQKGCFEAYSIALQACGDAAGMLDATCVAAADIAFVDCMVTCGQVPGLPDPATCAPGCKQAYADGVAACDVVNGAIDFACFMEKRSAFDACLSQCGVSLLLVQNPCVRACEAAFQTAVIGCKGMPEPNGVLDPAAAECYSAAQDAYDACLADCGITPPGEIRCASDCDQALKVGLAACAGDPACEKSALNDYTACLEKCGLVVPPIPEPDPCAVGCDLAYKQSLGSCYDQETGVADAECLGRADSAYVVCLRGCGIDLPDPPVNPNPDCTTACEIAYKAALNQCYHVAPDGVADVDEECLAAADAAFVDCLEPCGAAPGPLPGDPGLPVGDCEAKCSAEILGGLFDCAAKDAGGVNAECLAEIGNAFNECLTACKDKAGDQIRAALARSSNRTFIRGDTDRDGTIAITDAIGVLSYLFLGGSAPACRDASDANDDGVINIADASAILGYLFLGWGPLPAPFDALGSDPTTDSLDCSGS